MKSNWLSPRRRIASMVNRRRKAEVTMSNLLLTFLLIIFGLALTPTVGDQVAAATGGNITGAAAAILAQVPLVWVFLIVGIGAAAVVSAFESI